MDGIYEEIILLLGSTVLVAHLGEYFRHGWHANPHLGIERQHFESQVTRPRKSAEISKRVSKSRPTGPQSKPTTPRGP